MLILDIQMFAGSDQIVAPMDRPFIREFPFPTRGPPILPGFGMKKWGVNTYRKGGMVKKNKK
jgi:hypothetical protein